MRSDAARRRATIVREARRLFAEHGGAVALEAIADAGGVGIATLYRNFDTRADLADAVALSILTDIAQAADLARDGLPSQPRASWHDFLHRLVDLNLGALTEALAQRDGTLSAEVRTAQREALARVSDVLARARDADVVRAEIDATELIVAVGMITRPQPAAIRDQTPRLTARLTAILEAGLGAAAPESEPGPPRS